MKARSGRNAVGARMGQKISSLPLGRVCSDIACATVLSRYNASEFCSVHEPWRRWTESRP